MSLLQLSVYLATVLPKITIPWKVLNCDRDYLLHRVVVRNGCQASFSKRSLSRSHAALYHSWKKKKPKMSENACDFNLEHKSLLKWCGAKRGNFQALFAQYGIWDRMNHLRDSEEPSSQEFLFFCISHWKYTVFWWDHNERAYCHPSIFWSILSFHKVTYDFFFHSYASPVIPCIFQPQQTSHRVVHFKS